MEINTNKQWKLIMVSKTLIHLKPIDLRCKKLQKLNGYTCEKETIHNLLSMRFGYCWNNDMRGIFKNLQQLLFVNQRHFWNKVVFKLFALNQNIFDWYFFMILARSNFLFS